MNNLGYTIFAFFGTFALGMYGATLLQRCSPRLWVVIAGTPLVFAAYLLLLYALPFYSPFTEILLLLLAATVISGPMFLINHANRTKDSSRGMKFLMFGYFFAFVGGSIFNLLPRVNDASWLQWQCDGLIVDVTHNAKNHGHPVLVVADGGGEKRFEMVDSDVYGQAKPGLHLVKAAGSPMAWLEGKKVRMVPLQRKWWNEPK